MSARSDLADRGSRTHREYVAAHAIKRLRERYGIEIMRTEYERLCNDVRPRRRKPDAIGSRGDKAWLWRVSVRGVVAWAAWHLDANVIGTFYTDVEVGR